MSKSASAIDAKAIEISSMLVFENEEDEVKHRSIITILMIISIIVTIIRIIQECKKDDKDVKDIVKHLSLIERYTLRKVIVSALRKHEETYYNYGRMISSTVVDVTKNSTDEELEAVFAALPQYADVPSLVIDDIDDELVSDWN